MASGASYLLEAVEKPVVVDDHAVEVGRIGPIRLEDAARGVVQDPVDEAISDAVVLPGVGENTHAGPEAR